MVLKFDRASQTRSELRSTDDEKYFKQIKTVHLELDS